MYLFMGFWVEGQEFTFSPSHDFSIKYFANRDTLAREQIEQIETIGRNKILHFFCYIDRGPMKIIGEIKEGAVAALPA